MKVISLFFVSFLSFFVGYAQDNYDAELIPATLRSRANATIRNEETVVDMRSPDNVMYSVKQAITVLNKNGENNARLVLFYDKNTSIKSIKGEIYNEIGKLVGKFSQSDFKDESAVQDFSLFEDSRIKHYLPSVNTYPYTIVYTYEMRYKQNLIIPDWTPKPASDVSVEKSSYTFICKPTDQFRIKTQNLTSKAIESITDKQKSLVWTVNNLVGVKPEPYSPDRENYQTSVKIAPQNFSYFNYKGDYTNWQELGKWEYDNLLKNRKTLLPATIQAIKDLVKNEITDKEKARKIYQYLQNKTRYISVQIGIGGFQPVTAADVDRLGYGDCKALVNYMQSLLDVAGIESYYCIVQAGSQKKSLDPTYASMNQGNHVILCMPLKGDTTWLECTSQKIPFGFLSDFTDDRYVLACTAEGGKLLHTPKLTTSKNLQIRKADLSIDKDGNVTGNLKTIFSGAQYDNH
jgi:transglutaminase-like putative cysteine protease